MLLSVKGIILEHNGPYLLRLSERYLYEYGCQNNFVAVPLIGQSFDSRLHVGPCRSWHTLIAFHPIPLAMEARHRTARKRRTSLHESESSRVTPSMIASRAGSSDSFPKMEVFRSGRRRRFRPPGLNGSFHFVFIALIAHCLRHTFPGNMGAHRRVWGMGVSRVLNSPFL
ncbi:hypothetical protein CDAR_619751 [Caerostris darwini]|uniref:Uncharacterized protein n=1 Tax=Caerostris darwini TaxID=1538125 RepID=A0AAV4SCW7_9ARAC|nr:hypothetical protein CDAR_619751 [Caerostris darwini]